MRMPRVIVRCKRRVVTRDTPIALHLIRDRALRVVPRADTKLLTCRVIYQRPDYSNPEEIFPLPADAPQRVERYQVMYRVRPGGAGGRGRNFELVVNEMATDRHPDDQSFEHEIRMTTPHGTQESEAFLPIHPRERERIYVDFEESGDVELVNRNDEPIELGWRWCTPRVKIHEFLEYQYTAIYGAQKSGEGTRNAVVVKPHWDRHLRSGVVMVSRSGDYGPGAVCVTFVNVFLTYWSNLGRNTNNAWYVASNMAAIEARFADILHPPQQRRWRRFLRTLGDATPDTTDIYFCGSGGHVWLVLPLGGVYTARKKYIYGFGLAWEEENRTSPDYPGWFEEDCELGWYMVHASGPGVKPNRRGRAYLGIPGARWSTVFTGPGGLTRQQFEEGIIEGLEVGARNLSRPLPGRYSPLDFPWDARYSATETRQDLADNLRGRMNQLPDEEQFAIFAGTPLTWMNARVWVNADGTLQQAQTLDRLGNEIVVGLNNRRFTLRRLRPLLDDGTGWSSRAGWEENRDVRPIIWKEIG